MRAITLIEALVVMAVLAFLATVVLPALRPLRINTSRYRCLNNLKQIGLAYRIFAVDHQDRFPFYVSTNEGGSREIGGDAWRQFQALSYELATPKFLVCPTEPEKNRHYASNFTCSTPGTVSYYLNPDADERQPLSILSGDRHLATNGHRLQSGLALVSPASIFHWTRELHPTPRTNWTQGNMIRADGSAQRLTSPELIREFRGSTPQPTRLVMP